VQDFLIEAPPFRSEFNRIKASSNAIHISGSSARFSPNLSQPSIAGISGIRTLFLFEPADLDIINGPNFSMTRKGVSTPADRALRAADL
jgi:hypothetical protein